MHPADLSHLVLPSQPAISPDGEAVAVTVTRPLLDEDRYERRIWLWRGGTLRAFTAGPTDLLPAWSPSGNRLAFLRSSTGHAQVALIAADGGDAHVISDFDPAAESFAWAPDSQQIAVVALTRLDHTLDDAERARRPKRVSELPYRRDQEGFVHALRRRLFILTLDDSTPPREIECGTHDVRCVAWHPDGSRLAVVRDHPLRRGLDIATEVALVDLDLGDVTTVVSRGQWTTLSYRPDGVLHVVGHPDPDEHVELARLWRVDDDGLACLSARVDLGINPFESASQGGPQWMGDHALCAVERRGRMEVIRLDTAGNVETVVTGERWVGGFSAAPTGQVAFVAQTMTNPGELFLLDSSGEQCLSHFNDTFVQETPLSAGQHFVVSPGGTEVDAWVYLPAGDDPVPVLLVIHGGPSNQFGYGFFDEFQVYAGAGYGVVACNPRGSSGRGRAFLRGVMGDGWGKADAEDVTAALDTALARFPRLDPHRQAVMGGSYGGFLASWLTCHTTRFGSAVVERALTSWDSFLGTSDIPWLGRAYLGDGPEGEERQRAASPITYAHRVQTPTLIMHAEDDYRSPIEQAERLFTALLRAGVETEMLRFPTGGHELSRAGRPRHRVERFDAVLEWHDRHLAPGRLPLEPTATAELGP